MSSALEDKEAIRELLYEYCHHADSGDHAARASLFTEDAEFIMATRTARTRKGIEEYVASIWPPGGRPRRQHCMVNPLIRLNGDEARVESYVVMFREADGGPKVAYGGRYIDHVVKQGGRWLFRQRKIISDLDPNETGTSVHGQKP